jgi:hypothetical protein
MAVRFLPLPHGLFRVERAMLPMHTFDPTRVCKVHDQLNDGVFDWKPEWAEHYRTYAEQWPATGVIAWGDLILDGWFEFSPSIVSE